MTMIIPKLHVYIIWCEDGDVLVKSIQYGISENYLRLLSDLSHSCLFLGGIVIFCSYESCVAGVPIWWT